MAENTTTIAPDMKTVGASIAKRLSELETFESDLKQALEELIVEYGGTVPEDDDDEE
jgi:hypothetical protein